ncbi:MAG: flagellin, partial [Verrucomicrobiota bacterium]|nr:flagellin [Verrucomicrobiota bacterium]
GGSLTSSYSSLYLGNAQSMLSQSLLRLSSGQRINKPSDDPGGLAVSMKLKNAITVTEATKRNVDNALSYTDTQDSALESVADILDRMSTLKTSYGSGTATTSDKSSYASEFKELQKQLDVFKSETFNSMSLFSSSAVSKQVMISSRGESGPTISISSLNISRALSVSSGVNLANATGSVTISGISIGNLTTAITQVASLRATSGATSSRLQFSSDFLDTSKTNLEAANSRIMDVDVADEVTNYAKYNVQVYAASAALAQANVNMGIVLDLLNFGSSR